MAEEDKDKDLDLDVAPEEKPKSKLKLIIIVAVALVVLLGGAGAAFFMLSGGDEETDAAAEAEAVPVKKEAIYVPMNPSFVINYTSHGRQRYAQINVELMTRSDLVVPVLERHMPLIRNNLVTLFSSQEFEEITTLEGREAMRQLALEAIQEILIEEMGEPGLEQVLFTNFVIQ